MSIRGPRNSGAFGRLRPSRCVPTLEQVLERTCHQPEARHVLEHEHDWNWPEEEGAERRNGAPGALRLSRQKPAVGV